MLADKLFLSTLFQNQIIWDEVGESDAERDKMLLELEQECLEVYRRKVDVANRSRAQLRQAIADAEAELAAICSAMGERPVHIRQVSNEECQFRLGILRMAVLAHFFSETIMFGQHLYTLILFNLRYP